MVASVGRALKVFAVLVIPITITCALVAPTADDQPALQDHTLRAAAPPAFDTPLRADEEGVVDLYGNDVTDAVAKYKLDADGSLYESHSPQTQLPRLGSPKS